MIETFIQLFLDNPLGQSVGLLAMIILSYSGIIKDDTKMLYVLTASMAIWSVHFYLMGLPTAGFLYAFMFVRNLIMFRYNKNMYIFWIAIAIPIFSLLYTYESYIDIVVTLAPLIFIYSVYFLKGIQLRVGMILVSFIWLYYSIIGNSIGGIFTEVLYLGGIAIGMLQIHIGNKK